MILQGMTIVYLCPSAYWGWVQTQALATAQAVATHWDTAAHLA